ncbi:MAG TPA: AAA family ATPase [Acidimicrobiia bacterium]|nr:AAA family ATPase [Acidimicrobiia bacterium]
MLDHLRVRNLGVLEDAAIVPDRGFTVITGETGAGKTMLLGALRLLGGEKAKTAHVGPFAEEAVAEGLLGEDDDEVGVTRVVPRDGKSRAYVNGNVVAAAALEEKIGRLVDIVGQHDRLALRSPQAILGILDARLDRKGQAVRASYHETWARYREALTDQRRLGGDSMALERELDLLKYQAGEIAAAGLAEGDDLRMESMGARLRNAAVIRENLLAALDLLDRVTSGTGEVVSILRKLGGIDPAFTEQSEVADEVDARAHDLHRMMRLVAETVEEDPQALLELEESLTLLGDLKRKYGRTLDEVLQFGAAASLRVSELESLLAQATTIGEVVAGLEADLARIGADLSSARRAAAIRIEDEAKAHLAELGLATARLNIEIEPRSPGPSGADNATLSFSSDDRLAPGPIREVASGGELSRLMLALRLASKAPGGTMVFDEIDAGVGGITALALGRKLADLAAGTQVLCVTHLPQVAAYATTHYVVERVGPRAEVRLVDGESRLTELSRMLAGLPDSERGRDAAAELLEGAHRS